MKTGKPKYLLIFFLFAFVNFQILFSQSSSIKDFLPLNIGNTWVYSYNGAWPFGYFSGFEKYRIISTYNANGKLYYKFAHFRVVISGPSHVVLQSRLFKDTAAIRIDTISGNVYRNTNCSGSDELLVDSLNARLNDISLTCEPAIGDTVLCTDTNSITYFEILRLSRTFDMPGFESHSEQVYAKDIGLVSYSYNIFTNITWGTLRGCVINGIVIGDTGMVGIKQISYGVPENFTLSQNYPNPFNPITSIKFQIPKSGEVKLVIFDVLGREIETLVNEELQPGTYDAEWDASSYPSGVYFYKLITPDYTETRKMVLVK